MLGGLDGNSAQAPSAGGDRLPGHAIARDDPSTSCPPAGADQLTLISTRDRDVHRISVYGELDLASAPLVEHELARVEATDAALIVLDLSGLLYMDLTGVRLVLDARARSVAGADRLTVVRGPAVVQRLFELCGIAELLPFADA